MDVLEVREIGRRIKTVREKRGITQEELVRRIGEEYISCRTLIRLEKGIIKDPGIITLGRIANALKISIHSIISHDLLSKELRDCCGEVYLDGGNNISDQEYHAIIKYSFHPNDGDSVNYASRNINCEEWLDMKYTEMNNNKII